MSSTGGHARTRMFGIAKRADYTAAIHFTHTRPMSYHNLATDPGGPDFQYRDAPAEELNNPYAKSKGPYNTMKWCAWEVRLR